MTFLIGVHRFGVPFPKLQTFSDIFWSLHVDYSQYEEMTLEIFVYLFIYKFTVEKYKFSFLKQCRQGTTCLI